MSTTRNDHDGTPEASTEREAKAPFFDFVGEIPGPVGNCYCVCHSPAASRPACQHCKGDNEVTRANNARLPHPYSFKWQPFRSHETGQVVTITWEQVLAVQHAVRMIDDLRSTHGGRLLRDDFYGEKSRALGRLLVDGKPLFEECPPYSWGAADYGSWDTENEPPAHSDDLRTS